MLTYSSSYTVITILPLKKIVSAQLANFFWGSPFRSEEISNLRQDIERKWEIQLVNHREKCINASSAFIEKNDFPWFFKTILKESIFSLFQAYRQMLLWKLNYDLDDEINLLKEGGLYAPDYFTVDGDFNDFEWSKHLVRDPSLCIIDRFYVACFYWFKNESASLWIDLKTSDNAPFGGNLYYIQDRMEPLITLKIFHLVNQLQALTQNPQYSGNFLEVGFRRAAEKENVHTTYYFWQEIAEPEKINITGRNNYFELMNPFTDHSDGQVNYFLYSQLSKKRKEDLLDWTIENNLPGTWLTLLLSPYTQPIRSEIIEFVYRLPIQLYSNLLSLLARRIKILKLPFDIEIFQVLWCNLSPQETHGALVEGMAIIKNLVQAKSFYNLGYIIKGLSLEQKENCLFSGWYGAGITSLDILCKEGEFDLLQNYLSLFLIEIDPITHRQTLRTDASSFLQKFIESPGFRKWCQEEITKADEKKVNALVDALQENLTLLDELCEKVCKEVDLSRSPISTFNFNRLSPAKIYCASIAMHKKDSQTTTVKNASEVNEETELISSSSSQKRKYKE